MAAALLAIVAFAPFAEAKPAATPLFESNYVVWDNCGDLRVKLRERTEALGMAQKNARPPRKIRAADGHSHKTAPRHSS